MVEISDTNEGLNLPRKRLKPAEVLDALLKISAVISSRSNWEQILAFIAESAMKVFSSDSCRIHRFDPISLSFVSEASAGLGAQMVHTPRSDGLGKKVLDDGRHIWEDRVEKLNPIVQDLGIRSAGVFPLHPADGKPVGTLYLHFRKNPHFLQDEIDLVYHFSYHAGSAIQQMERIRDLEALRDASIEVARATSVKEALGRIVKSAAEILHTDAAILYPWNEDDETFISDLVVDLGLNMEVLKLPPPHPKGLTHTVFEEGGYWIEDVETAQDDRADIIKTLKDHVMSVNDLRSFIGTALRSGDDRVGVLYVFYRTAHKVSEEEISTLSLFAEMAATRIQLAKLSEAQETAATAEAIAILSAAAVQFAHRLSNVAGTIPIIVGDLEIKLFREGIADDKIFTRLGHLRDDTQRLMDMATELTLGDIGNPVPVDLGDVVRQAIKAVQLNLDIEVCSDLHQESIQVNAVEVYLVDIVINLLENAEQAKATSVVICTADRPEEGMINLYVHDDGTGIQKPDTHKIFMPLYSTKKRGDHAKPHGTGLWVSYHQIKRMGGKMSMESTPEVGTRFTISLKKS